MSPSATAPTRRRPGSSGTPCRQGVVLLDVVISVSITAVLFAGMAGAVAISMRAGDSSLGPSSASHAAAKAALAITREVQHATAFNSAYSNATRVEFTVPDRTGDGVADTIRYAWSGVSGDPLYRTFNGGAAEEVLANVQVFSLKYHTQTVQPPVVSAEGNETQLLDQSGSVLLSLWQDVTTTAWIGTHVAPSLPSGAVSFRITRIQAYLNATSSDHGLPLLQIRKADAAKKPTDVVVGQAIGAESSYSSNWYTFTFDNAGGLIPADGACIVIASGNGTSEIACSTRYTILTSTSSTTLLSTSDGGATWSTNTANDLWMRVWGRATTETAGSGDPRYYRTGIDVAIRSGSDTRSTVTTSVETLNRPEVSAP